MSGVRRENGGKRARRIVWITGASSGIGAALAREMARQGYVVAASARKIAELKTLEGDAARLKGSIHAYPCDVEDRLAMSLTASNIAREIGTIDIAVFNAGVYLPLDGRKIDSAVFRKSFDVNVMGVVHGLEAVVPAMVARQGGRIVIVLPDASGDRFPALAAYGATKAALAGIARSIRFDLAKAKTAIQIINPGLAHVSVADAGGRRRPFSLFTISAERAARRIMRGIHSGKFEIRLPQRLVSAVNLVHRFLRRA